MFPFTQLVSTKTSGCAYAAIVLRSGLSEVLHRYIPSAYRYSYPTWAGATENRTPDWTPISSRPDCYICRVLSNSWVSNHELGGSAGAVAPVLRRRNHARLLEISRSDWLRWDVARGIRIRRGVHRRYGG